jgi:predicted DNA-binding transcriptional regulator AlpA
MATEPIGTLTSNRAVRLNEVCQLLGASRATIWRWTKSDLSFPKPFHLGPAVTCWDYAELIRWVEGKKAARHSGD